MHNVHTRHTLRPVTLPLIHKAALIGLFAAPLTHLEQQVFFSPEAPSAAAGIKVSLGGHEHRRLQDVAAASVVLETAIVKVHGSGQGLEIESHCEARQRNKSENVRGLFN